MHTHAPHARTHAHAHAITYTQMDTHTPHTCARTQRPITS